MTRQMLLLSMLLTPAVLAEETTVFKVTGKIPEGQFSSYGTESGADGVFFPAALSSSPGDGLIASFTAYRNDDRLGRIFCGAFGTFPMSSVSVTGGTMQVAFTTTAFCFDSLGGITLVPDFTWTGTFTLIGPGAFMANFESTGTSTSTTFPTGCPGIPGICTVILRNTGRFVSQSANFVGSVGSVSVEATAGSNGSWRVRSGSATATYIRQ